MPAVRCLTAARWLALAAAAIALPACGDDSERAVRDTLAQTFAAFAARDPERLCELFSKEAEVKLGLSAHGEPPLDCRRDVRRYTDWIQPYRSGAAARVDSVQTTDDGTATVELSLPDERRTTLTAREEDGSWRLDGFFDASLSASQASTMPARAERLPVWKPPPATPADGSVAVRDTRDDRRCPAIDTSTRSDLTGGCVLELSAKDLDASLWGPFGVAYFGRCDFSYTVRVDGSGNAWVVDFMLDGPSPCDALACRDREFLSIPWPATIERDGSGSIRLRIEDACLNTCVGQFEGGWDIKLAEGTDAWRARFASPLGGGGLRVDGALTSTGNPIAID